MQKQGLYFLFISNVFNAQGGLVIKVYLFDWGDTLMVDFPHETGKMCEWDIVEAVAEAKSTLSILSQHAHIYIATGAADSTETEIKHAFARAELSQFISGYFCKANVGISKGTPEFLLAILDKLQVPAANVAVVGDNFEKDIKPAIATDIQAFWFTNNDSTTIAKKVTIIHHLSALYQ